MARKKKEPENYLEGVEDIQATFEGIFQFLYNTYGDGNSAFNLVMSGTKYHHRLEAVIPCGAGGMYERIDVVLTAHKRKKGKK